MFDAIPTNIASTMLNLAVVGKYPLTLISTKGDMGLSISRISVPDAVKPSDYEIETGANFVE
jgi:hypothetical protein